MSAKKKSLNRKINKKAEYAQTIRHGLNRIKSFLILAQIIDKTCDLIFVNIYTVKIICSCVYLFQYILTFSNKSKQKSPTRLDFSDLYYLYFACALLSAQLKTNNINQNTY